MKIREITKEEKISEAKRFVSFHKEPIFDLDYKDWDEVWEVVWNYIWNELSVDGSDEPYIEISMYETKSGATEIFELSLDEGDGAFLFACDMNNITEWSPEGILRGSDFHKDTFLREPESGEKRTAWEWANMIFENPFDSRWKKYLMLSFEEV